MHAGGRDGCGWRGGLHGEAQRGVAWCEEGVDGVESDNDLQGNGGEGIAMGRREKKREKKGKKLERTGENAQTEQKY